jgi:hypothetical protein
MGVISTFVLLFLLAGDLQAFVPVQTRAAPLSTLAGMPRDSTSLNLCPSLFGCSTTAVEPVLNNRHSASDWLYNVRSMPQSQVLREIRNPVLSAAAWSFVVSLAQRMLSVSSKDSLRGLAEHICIPSTAHGLLVSSLGLLLVFRTNSAYQRFNVSLLWRNRFGT